MNFTWVKHLSPASEDVVSPPVAGLMLSFPVAREAERILGSAAFALAD